MLRGPGVELDLGSTRIALRSPSSDLARQMLAVYPEFPLQAAAAFADIRVDIRWPRTLRRFVRRQVTFWCDGEELFEPFPADTPLPMFEWGANWLIGQRLNHLLMFHAGCVERDGRALVLPATPGSGKSTLSAALAHSGWRLMSDEFGVLDAASGTMRAMLKPIALKNESIEVIRSLAPQATIGPVFPKTRRGAVAHVAASADAVLRRHEAAQPGLVVLPRWERGSATRLEAITDDETFRALAYNSFNYEVLGELGFRSVVRMVRQCPGYRLTYSNLPDALRCLAELWQQTGDRHAPADPDA